MHTSDGGLIERTALGAPKSDRSWMTTFWEVFCDCVVETDAQFNITNLLRKADSTMKMDGLVGQSFLALSVEADRAFVLSELKSLKAPGVGYKRFTFLSVLGRYYRMTLAPSYEDGLFAGLHGISVDVTEEKRREVTMSWQRAVIEGSSDFISISDPEGHVLYTNPGAYKMTGYDPAAGGLPPERIYIPGHIEELRREGIPQAVSGGSWTGRGELVRADGTRLPIEHTVFSVKNNNGDVILLADNIKDITEFVEHERTIRIEQRQTGLLASVAMSFSMSDDFDGSVNEALASIGGYMGIDSMYIYRDNRQTFSYACDYLWSAGDAYGLYVGREIPYIDPDTGAYTAEYALLKEVPIFVADDMSLLEEGLFAKARNAGVKSMLNLPIHVDGEFWGVIGLNMYTRQRGWSDRDIRFLKTICGILSTSLEKRLMAQRWTAAQANLQAVLDNVPSAIYWKDINLKYLGANKRYLDFYGLRERDIVGKHISDVLNRQYVNHVDETDRSLMESGDDTRSEDMQAVRADGQVRWIANSRVLMRDEKGEITSLLGVFDDITESKENERRAAESLSQLKAVVGNYPGLIWSLDINRRFTLYDGSFMSGDTRFDLIGQNIHELVADYPGMMHASIPERVELTFAGEPQHWEYDIGQVIFSCYTMPITDGKGSITGVVAASMDVTGMIRLQKELEEARVAAEAASVAKSEFLSRMSHEIRTPMNAIIGMTQIAQNSGDEARIRNCLVKIDSASKHLLALINDILDISKIEANKLELQNESFDLEKCVGNIRGMIAVRLEEKNQSFDLHFGSALPGFVMGDELRFTQVVINLLGNAVKFTPENGMITLSVEERERDGDQCLIEVRVKDNGIGLSPEQQSKLFTAFEQADGSVTRKYGGTGLGLAICKRIVEMMGGAIWVESVLGEGSVFAFTVRMQISDPAMRTRYEQDRQIIRIDDISKLRILAVDDSAETLDYLTHILEGHSLKCDTAANGAQAVDRVERAAAAGAPYDIIFIDYKMPEMDGITAAKRIVEIMPEGVALIMISVTDWRDIEQEARAAGISRYLVKPFSPTGVLNAINEVTGTPEVERDRRAPAAGDDDFSRFTILLVEDVDINREIVYAMLEDTGIHIEHAENGVQAVEMFSAAPGKYDLILMDVQMPEMDGMEATRRIRAMNTPEAEDITIVAMTANVFREDVDKCKAAGMNDHIAKPIDSGLLMEKLNEYLFMRGYRHSRKA